MNENTGTILCVGSLHYDVLVESPRIPQRGETVVANRWIPKFGGKGGNQAVAAAKAGASVRMLGAVGHDSFGEHLIAQLRVAGVDAGSVRVLSSPTGMSVAITESDGDYGAAIVSGANLGIVPTAVTDSAIWTDVEMVLLQNEVSVDVNIAAARKARENGATVCLNAAPFRELPYKLAGNVDILVVNTIEAGEMLNTSAVPALDPRTAASALLNPFEIAIVTAGGQGVGVARRNGDTFSIPAKEVTVANTHGAGDVFVGALCAKLTQGFDLKSATEAAVICATDHVSKAD